MPSQNKNTKPWERGHRVRQACRPLRRILILCEDTKSSVRYLEKFPHDPDVVKIECRGTGKNTDSLMEEAVRRKEEAEKQQNPCEAIWVVFDKDAFSAAQFGRAFDLAGEHSSINACWSNECFELWYLLHFGLRETAIGRKDIFREISKKLGKKYDKSDPDIFEALKPRLPDAMKHAATLFARNASSKRRHANPSTRVHQLVRMLLAFAPEKHAPV
jgi:hypothetical protein